MSYILEALKKSDKERRHQSGSLPLKELAPLASRQRKSNTLLLLLIISLAVVSSSAGTYWYFKYLQQNPQQTAQLEPQTQETTPQPIAKVEEQYIPPSPVEAEPVIYQPAPILELPEVTGAAITDEIDLSRPTYPKLMYIDDLPLDIKNELPKLQMAGHAYAAEPADRLIIINDKIMRQGTLITDHLLLKEIIHEGIVLEYKTIAFQILLEE